MAVTAPKKEKIDKPDPLLEQMDVIQVTRDWLAEHPPESLPTSRSWASLVQATLTDRRCTAKRVLKGDNSCTYAWAYVAGHPQAPARNIAWFRKGPEGQAMLYQQGWRAVDPPDDPPVPVPVPVPEPVADAMEVFDL